MSGVFLRCRTGAIYRLYRHILQDSSLPKAPEGRYHLIDHEAEDDPTKEVYCQRHTFQWHSQKVIAVNG